MIPCKFCKRHKHRLQLQLNTYKIVFQVVQCFKVLHRILLDHLKKCLCVFQFLDCPLLKVVCNFFSIFFPIFWFRKVGEFLLKRFSFFSNFTLKQKKNSKFVFIVVIVQKLGGGGGPGRGGGLLEC
jgi:hypothetical protein